jgi:DNA-binding SARP family transcriptional activator
MATGIACLGEIQGRRGLSVEAARLLGCAEATRDTVGARAFPIDRIRQDALLPELRHAAGTAAFDEAWQEGRLLDPLALLNEVATRAAVATAGAAAVQAPGAAAGGAAVQSPGAAAGSVAPQHPVPRLEAVALVRDARVVASAAAAPAVVPQLRVQALGTMQIAVDGAAVAPERWVYAKPRELLIYLLLQPRGATRDQIGEALWPGAARSNVKNSFHVTLHHVRKALGRPEWIVRETDRYLLDPHLTVEFDASEFEAAARQVLRPAVPDHDRPAALRRTLELYRGDLLEGETCGRWIDDHRDGLRRLYLAVGMELGTTLESTEPDRAAALYEALVAREELDEELHRRLMSIRVRTGDRVRALRHYDRLVALLHDTLDAEPEPETVALYDRIRAGSADVSARSA